MNSQQFLFINFLIFLALVLFFVFGRSKAKQSMQLNLKADAKSGVKAKSEAKDINKISDTVSDTVSDTNSDKNPDNNEEARLAEARDVSKVETVAIAAARELRKGAASYFIYNGHEWEAFEVLGLPKGTSLQMATSHYQKLIKTSDPSTFDFFEAAYSAVLKSKSKD